MDRIRRWWFLLGGLAAAPFLVAVVDVAGRPYAAVADGAKNELRARDVWTAGTPLTGLISRWDWNHPGPAMFWLLSPTTLVVRNSAWAVRVTYVVLAIAALVAASVLAWTLGRRIFTVVVLTALLSALALPAAVYRTPWNPRFPLPLLILLVVLVARVAWGHGRDVIGVVVVGSVMVQTHAGTAPLVIGATAVAVAYLVIDARRSDVRVVSRATFVWAAAALTLLWALPVIGAVRHTRGNLVTLGRYFVRAPNGHLGLHRAAAIVADEFRWPVPWLGGAARYARVLGYSGYVQNAQGASVLWLAVPALALVGGFIAARVRADARWTRLLVLASVLLVVTVLAISRSDEPFAYTFAFRAVVAPFVVLVPAVAIVELLGPPRAMAVGAVGAVVVAAFAVALLAPRLHPSTDDDAFLAAQTRTLARRLDRVPLADRTVSVRNEGPSLYGDALFSTLVNELDRRGAEVTVRGSDYERRIVGDGRVSSPRRADEVWIVSEDDATTAGALARPGARILWRPGAGSRAAIIVVPVTAATGASR